ncbi:MAG: mannose-1-phosphate guanylyltransferase [Bacteroidota bacterium]
MGKPNNYVAIMAGGVGSRFWPGSRESFPKQFLDIMGVGKSLIRLTFERFLRVVPASNILILTNERYKGLVLEHLPELTENQVLCEPSRNNTAPCVAYATYRLAAIDPNANFVIAPSDAFILNPDAFVASIQKGLDFVDQNDAIVTLGIQPRRPDTGFGYVQFEEHNQNGVHKVIRFTEKPDLETAKRFVDSGDYLWNAGIFLWKVSTVKNAFHKHAPDICSHFDPIADVFNTEREAEVLADVYPQTPKISVDYAIMEKAENVYTIPSEFGWSDLGNWNSLHKESPERDEKENVILADHSIIKEASNNLIRVPREKLVVVKGLEDYIVVDEGNVLLIYPKNKEQEIKAIRNEVKDQFGERFA